jgi:PAS domain S-box-containing protein
MNITSPHRYDQRAGTAGGAVLIVEDDAGVAALEQRRLERSGFAVLTAATAEEALRFLEENDVALMLLDYRLPGDVDGIDFFSRVKEAGYDLPVILVTAFSTEATVIRALRVGVRDFVSKSLDFLDYLPAAVGRVLDQVRTERQLAESQARLRASQERFEAFMNNSPTVAFLTDADGRLLYVNRTWEEHFGRGHSQWLGKTAEELWPAEIAALLRQHDREVLAAGKPLEVAETVPDARGSPRQWLVYKFPVPDASGPRLLGGIALDVTEKKKLETQLAQAQRLESIGVLAGGVAHDFNSLLTVILGNAELLLLDLPPDDPARELLGEITKAGELAALLVRQLLAFSRRQICVPQVLDLNSLVTETEKILRRHVGPDIYMTAALDPALYRVKADPGQLEQVLMNLVFNARDAMPAGGHLVIETRNTVLDEPYAESHPPARPGPFAVLAVADSGVGMDETVKSHLFEPFFTTKEPGKGTGLGLSTVYGVVTQAGGHVEVSSSLGHGSTFRVYLPRAEDPTALPMTPGDAPPSACGHETVLLVEHEEKSRRMARYVLETHGYTVLQARDGREAVQVFQRHRGEVHLLLTDVVTPTMSGRKLAEQLMAQRPGMKVLYLSDYVNVAQIRSEDATVLAKPVSVSTLTRKVRDVLDEVKEE